MTQVQQKPSTHAALADELLDNGIPVVVCRPNPDYSEDDPSQPELFPPSGWNRITVEEAREAYKEYRPGIDTLAMVAGHGIDVLDIDTKVSGVSLSDVPHDIDKSNGITVTPSQGFHIPVRSTGYSSGSLYFSGKYVGDYCGGTKDGGGRKLVYLPGSSRPKYEGKVYSLARDWDIEKILDSDPDDALISCLDVCPGLSLEGSAGSPMAEKGEIDAFFAEHSEAVDCSYGKAAMHGDPMFGTRGVFQAVPDFGSPDSGLHAWITRTVNRAVELCRDGCLDASIFAEIEVKAQKLALNHPQKGRWRSHEVTDCLRWAITNVKGGGGCRKHDPSLAKSVKTAPSAPKDDLWEAHPLLEWIKPYAEAHMVSPSAVLMAFLAFYSAEVPYKLRVDTGIGSPMPLNIYTALVGRPGMGKSSAVGCAKNMFEMRPLITREAVQFYPVSGEGIIDVFVVMKTEKYKEMDPHTGEEVEKSRKVTSYVAHRAVGIVDEIETLKGSATRAGNILMPILRTAWSGGVLATSTRAVEKRAQATEYSIGLIVGIQPGHSQWWFDSSEGGTPQRFIWGDAAIDYEPKRVKPTTESAPFAMPTAYKVIISDDVLNEIWQLTAASRIDGIDNPLDTHSTQIRARIACLFALMEKSADHTAYVTAREWSLAGRIMDHSASVRDTCTDFLAEAQAEQQSAEAVADVERDERKHSEQVQRTVGRVVEKLDAHGPLTRKKLRSMLSKAQREVLTEVLLMLEANGEAEKGSDGYFLT